MSNPKIYTIGFTKKSAEQFFSKLFKSDKFHQACLLCSEDTPEHCHRRLVAEYLRDKWEGVEIRHIL